MCQSSECGCNYPGHHGHGGSGRAGYHHQGCCCGSSHGMRRFLTRQEIIANLEEYLEQLKAEVEGVGEKIAELKKTA